MRGYWPARLHCGKFRTLDYQRIITTNDKGTPDWAYLHGIYPGFLLEVKRPGEEPRPEQALKITELRQGYRLAVVVVDNARALSDWLDEHEYKTRARWHELLKDFHSKQPLSTTGSGGQHVEE